MKNHKNQYIRDFLNITKKIKQPITDEQICQLSIGLALTNGLPIDLLKESDVG